MIVDFPRGDKASDGAGASEGTGALAWAFSPVREAPTDWTNQELADLYRVEALLVQANIRIETDRGLTDEGDPWFVFCRPDGEVFVSLSRFDGLYILDSPSLPEVLKGKDFPDLIVRFMTQVAARAASGNVVQLHPHRNNDTTVRAHPAIMLTALVWALYLAADDIMGVANAAEAMNDHDETQADASLALQSHITALMADDAAFAFDHLSAQIAANDTATAINIPTVDLPLRPLAGSEERANASLPAMPGAGISAVAASLAAIALAYGLYDILAVDSLPGAGLAGASLLSANLQDEAVEAPSGLSEQQPANGGEVETGQTVSRDVGTEAPTTELEAEAVTMAIETIEAELDPTARTLVHAYEDVVLTGDQAIAELPHIVQIADREESLRIAFADTVEIDSMQAVIDAAIQHIGALSDYTIGGVSVAATFDVASAEILSFSPNSKGPEMTLGGEDILTLLAPVKAPAFSSLAVYDERAKSFIHNFLQKSDTIEMIQFNNTVILMDLSAIEQAASHAYSRSWVFDDGGSVISTIGHLQDFLDYGLA